MSTEISFLNFRGIGGGRKVRFRRIVHIQHPDYAFMSERTAELVLRFSNNPLLKSPGVDVRSTVAYPEVLKALSEMLEEAHRYVLAGGNGEPPIPEWSAYEI